MEGMDGGSRGGARVEGVGVGVGEEGREGGIRDRGRESGRGCKRGVSPSWRRLLGGLVITCRGNSLRCW